MASNDEAARKARADAIRRARDRHQQQSPDRPAGTSGSSEVPVAADEREGSGGPNYAAWIDKKMREEQ